MGRSSKTRLHPTSVLLGNFGRVKQVPLVQSRCKFRWRLIHDGAHISQCAVQTAIPDVVAKQSPIGHYPARLHFTRIQIRFAALLESFPAPVQSIHILEEVEHLQSICLPPLLRVLVQNRCRIYKLIEV